MIYNIKKVRRVSLFSATIIETKMDISVILIFGFYPNRVNIVVLYHLKLISKIASDKYSYSTTYLPLFSISCKVSGFCICIYIYLFLEYIFYMRLLILVVIRRSFVRVHLFSWVLNGIRGNLRVDRAFCPPVTIVDISIRTRALSFSELSPEIALQL